jgi:hypothetical protein
MSYDLYLISLVIICGILLISVILHSIYLYKIKNRFELATNLKMDINELSDSISINQGTGFNIALVFTWSLFFNALIYLYFLKIHLFKLEDELNSLNFATNVGGFIVLSLPIILLSIPFTVRIVRIYEYYLISKRTKMIIAHLAPILIFFSLLLSINCILIYPMQDYSYWFAAYITLSLSLIILSVPIIYGFVKVIQ